MSVLNNFQEKFKVNELLISETAYWIWSLRPHQSTLGSGILSLKRECANFSDVSKEEFADLKVITSIIENTLKSSFKYDVLNYLMLMMQDTHVHYHVIPRYKNPVTLHGYIWTDENWPSLPLVVGNALEFNDLQKIKSILRGALVERSL